MKDTKYGDATLSTMTMKVGDLVISKAAEYILARDGCWVPPDEPDAAGLSVHEVDIGIVLNTDVNMWGEEVIPTGVTILLDSGEIETTWEDDFEVINEER